ncbi:hypothetical protein C1646_371089 [Rhizophagus diaphanus]|nr:hypothetical protein C1646_371089 [Rhizophagus diaphanus] [Rhizophagus sp. MUCL 43196]
MQRDLYENYYQQQQILEVIQATAHSKRCMIDILSNTLESVEAFTEKIDPSFQSRRQIRGKSLQDENGIAEDYRHTAMTQCSSLLGIIVSTKFPEVKAYAQKEFYMWLANSTINSQTCFPELAYLLITIDKLLKGEYKKFLEDSKLASSQMLAEVDPKQLTSLFSDIQKFNHETQEIKKSYQGKKFNEVQIESFSGNENTVQKGLKIFEVIEKLHFDEYESRNLMFPSHDPRGQKQKITTDTSNYYGQSNKTSLC